MATATAMKETLAIERSVEAPADEVFRAFTSPHVLREWLCNAAQVAPRVGGRIYLWWNDGYFAAGEFTKIERGKLLAFTWHGRGEPHPTDVRVTLEERDGVTNVRVEHAGLGAGPEWSDDSESIWSGWEFGLENLQSVLETGVDQRLARRPMFGLNGAEELTPQLAEKLGVPSTEGLVLQGLVEGMGAEAAGLRKGDVLVGLGAKPVVGWESLGVVLSAYKAGDELPVAVYRDGAKQTLTMTLSPRPAPELASTQEAIVQAAREAYATLDKELDECVAGIGEEEADYRPEPDAWSAREVLAHLVAAERDSHHWMASLAEDVDAENRFFSNHLVRVQALASVFPTLPALAEELKRNEAISVAMLAAMPPGVIERKHQFRELAQSVGSLADHIREHFAEMTALAQAARESA